MGKDAGHDEVVGGRELGSIRDIVNNRELVGYIIGAGVGERVALSALYRSLRTRKLETSE